MVECYVKIVEYTLVLFYLAVIATFVSLANNIKFLSVFCAFFLVQVGGFSALIIKNTLSLTVHNAVDK